MCVHARARVMKIYKWVEVTALKCTPKSLQSNDISIQTWSLIKSNRLLPLVFVVFGHQRNHFELDKLPCGSHIHRLRYQLILGRSNGSQCDHHTVVQLFDDDDDTAQLTTKKLKHHKIHEQSIRIERNKRRKTVREKKPETRALLTRQRCTNGFVRCAAARLYVVEWLQAICTIFMIYLSAHVGNDRFPLKCVYDQNQFNICKK